MSVTEYPYDDGRPFAYPDISKMTEPGDQQAFAGAAAAGKIAMQALQQVFASPEIEKLDHAGGLMSTRQRQAALDAVSETVAKVAISTSSLEKTVQAGIVAAQALITTLKNPDIEYAVRRRGDYVNGAQMNAIVSAVAQEAASSSSVDKAVRAGSIAAAAFESMHNREEALGGGPMQLRFGAPEDLANAASKVASITATNAMSAARVSSVTRQGFIDRGPDTVRDSGITF